MDCDKKLIFEAKCGILVWSKSLYSLEGVFVGLLCAWLLMLYEGFESWDKKAFIRFVPEIFWMNNAVNACFYV